MPTVDIKKGGVSTMAICSNCKHYADNCNWNENCGYKETDEYTSMTNRVQEADFSTWNFAELINYGEVGEYFVDMPNNFTPIEISDGEIIDSGYTIGGNFYFDKFYKFIGYGFIDDRVGLYWKYKDRNNKQNN